MKVAQNVHSPVLGVYVSCLVPLLRKIFEDVF